ncbi:Glucose oxidase like protein [Verticillium longisporum]|uniref:Glucose oxidase like protein n=1 Tax=Verticillium longisporum TaxID=100787 RepID=A0A8I2ZMY2_VERLO|nr:Glucose oxidase like protein [Verticillium longisporum]
MLPYFKKSEKYFIPREDQLAAGASYEPQHHGFKGPLHVGLAPAFTNTSASPRLHAAWESLSVPRNPDFNSGSVRGYSYPPSTLDPTLNVRYDSSRAYIHPVEHRPNLQILQGTVKRITWARQLRKQTQCQGKGILKALGIETKIDLPGVGENLLEQPHHTLVYNGNLEESTNAFYAYITAENLFGERLAAVEASSRARIPEFARASVEASGDGALNATVIEKLFTIQHDLMFKKSATIAEILTIIAVGLQFSDYWILFPFSRGSVHLSSKEDIDKPLFDPRLMLADFDVQTTVAAGRLAKRFWQSEPVAAYVGGQVLPDAVTLPDDATDAQWETWARNNAVPNAHPVGTASMMSRELGGVVDPELKVYGTANVRIVDASVMPIQTSGHLTSTIYALAERLSDIIKDTA